MAADTKVDATQDGYRGTLPVGTRLRNYELLSILGHGGFGITYYARDTTLGREVAIKEYLPTSLAIREDGTMVVPRSTQLAEDFVWGRERFLEEARILASLEGAPAVVHVHDFLEANGTAYMVMGLVRGDTLEQRLKRDGQLSAPVIANMFDRLLDGLEAVHKAGFLHRDIKPANIMLDVEDHPTLIDFGASRASIGGRTSALTAIYTPRYAAAEQFTSHRQGPWTDIYGLSATLHHAITGDAPPSSLERVLNDTYKPLTELSPAGFPRELLERVDAGLAVLSRDRPQSIAAWRGGTFSAPTPAGDSTVIKARSKSRKAASSPIPRASPPAQVEPPPPAVGLASLFSSRRSWAAAAGVVAAVLVVLAGGYWAFERAPAPASTPVKEVNAGSSDEAARQKAEVDARQLAEAEARQEAEAEARQKAEANAEAQKAAAEAKEKADADAKLKVEGDTEAQKAAAQAREKADADARLRAQADAEAQEAAAQAKQRAEEADARLRAETEAKQKAQADAEAQKAAADAKQKADAEAAAQKLAAETAETALRLGPSDRQHIQVALTSLGFDTRGFDGVLGPRSREMIQAWQQAGGNPATGFLTAGQRQALLGQAAAAVAKFDEDEKRKAEAAAKAAAEAAAKAEADARAAEAAARARAASQPPPTAAPNQPPPNSSQSGGGGPNVFLGLGSSGHGGGGVFIGVGPSSSNQSSVSRDQVYCDKLSQLYRRYEQNSPGRRFDVAAASALEDCQRGNTASGIPVLENILRGDGFTLPPR
jgi:serine/threonine protein kinase/peptidoglycan hydrolase-like protein with peptidoglycan-binding domain